MENIQKKYPEYYSELLNRMRKLSYISNAISILGWDSKTYMPPKGIQQRGMQISILSGIIHERLTDPKNGELLSKCEKDDSLDMIARRNVELIRREYDKATKLPHELVERLSKQEVITENLWERAKKKADFALIKPELTKLIDLVKKKAELLDPDKQPYDVLLDLYEPKATAAEITRYFDPLKEAVIKLVKKFQSNIASDPALSRIYSPDILRVDCTLEQQQALSKFLIEFTGLDPQASRLDVSEHPFTTGYADDVRITTHYLDRDPMGSFYSVMHEAGHALYELNLPREHLWTPVGESISLGVHESQSRFNENIIGKSPEFLSFSIPKIFDTIPEYKKQNISPENFIKAVNFIQPSKIRIYADEVTYNLHVILRFEIERELFAEKIDVNELPSIWNQKMEEYLGQKIENDKEGVLQDTHWYGGALGYFPTYVLGNIYGGQMLNTIAKQIPDWKEQIRRGDYSKVREWLIKNVHNNGSLYDPADLIEHITGEKPDAKYFIGYLNEKFSTIYGL